MQSFYKSDCRFFKGEIPCKPHKDEDVKCDDCRFYDKIKSKILIIKLGAIGDVIRTTPLIEKLKIENPGSEIWWLTYSPEVVPSSVDKILKFNLENITILQSVRFDKLINLDKDLHACSLANTIDSSEKYGFLLVNGKPAPANELAEHKFLTGIFDDLNKENTKSYPQEIFEICGFDFSGEKYRLEIENDFEYRPKSNGKKVIGLNTGCGERWTSRLWEEDNWIELTNQLRQSGYYPLILGGSQEHEKNQRIAEKTGAEYPGHFPLKRFFNIVNCCDLVVTTVTMGLHIAIALDKKIVLINNIFNPKEFELYGKGLIVEPDEDCKCFFSPKCKNQEYFCLDHLPASKISDAVKRLL